MEHRSGRGKEGEPADYLERWLKVQRNYSFAGSPSPPLFFFVPLFDGDASEKVRLYEDALKIYGISEWFSSRYTQTNPSSPHDEEHLFVFLCTHACTWQNLVSYIYIYTHIFTWNVGKRGVRRTMQYVPTTKFALRVLSAGLANSMHREALRKVVELTVAWLLDLYRIHASFIRMQILIQKWRFLRNEEMDFELFM